MIRSVLACALCAGVSAGQQPGSFATHVVAANTNGNAGGGVFNPGNALGAPDGTFGVHTLGIGGSLTLGFGVLITDGPGPDLLIAENPFFAGALGNTFAEVVFVEVSSNGVDFARVPSRYDGPQSEPGAFGVVDVGYYDGLGGAIPVRVAGGAPRDPVRAGGDAIELGGLVGHPLVLGGRVDLGAITLVRLIDVRSGLDMDGRGVLIRDAGAGSADIDAVTVLHPAGLSAPSAPRIDLLCPASGRVLLTIEDPDGLGDLDFAAWRVSFWGLPVLVTDVLPAFDLVGLTPTSLTLRLVGDLPPGMSLRLTSSIEDRGGGLGVGTVVRPLR